MTNILLIYPPFCTPASPPYSLTYLHAFLQNNLPKEYSIAVLDLNVVFHKLKFSEFYEYYKKGMAAKGIAADYTAKTKQFLELTGKCYATNNKRVVQGENPELLDELIAIIKKKSADVVAMSIVYSSQAFYAFALLKELKKLGIKTVIGGPAVNNKLQAIADVSCANEVALLEHIIGRKVAHGQLNVTRKLDFSVYALSDHFTPAIVLPLRTSQSCYYKQCTFCTHHGNAQYIEHSLDDIKQTIIDSQQKYFFFIDDMIPRERLLELAAVLKELRVLLIFPPPANQRFG